MLSTLSASPGVNSIPSMSTSAHGKKSHRKEYGLKGRNSSLAEERKNMSKKQSNIFKKIESFENNLEVNVEEI